MQLRRTLAVLAVGGALLASAPAAVASPRASRPAHTTSEMVNTRSSSCDPSPRSVTCTVTNITGARTVFVQPGRRSVPVITTYMGVEVNKIAYDAAGDPTFVSSTFGSSSSLDSFRIEGVGRTLLGTNTGRDILEWSTASASDVALQTYHPDRLDPVDAGTVSVEVLLDRTELLGPDHGYPAPAFERGPRGRILNGASSDATATVTVDGASPGRLEFARTTFTHDTCAEFDDHGCVEEWDF